MKPIRSEREAVAALQGTVTKWLADKHFQLVPPEVGDLPIDVDLELSEESTTTLWKCLFADYE